MKIYSTAIQVKPIEFDGQKVRVRSNIEQVTIDQNGTPQTMWQYDEEVITVEELAFRKAMGEL